MKVTNRNQAISSSSRMLILGMDEVNFFIQNVELPGVSMMGVDTPYQNFGLNMPSNRIEYEPINIGFLIDESYANYESLLKWMIDIRETEPVVPLMKDVTLHLTTSNKTKNVKIVMVGAYPTNLSSIPFDISQIDPTPLVCTLTLRYQIFRFER